MTYKVRAVFRLYVGLTVLLAIHCAAVNIYIDGHGKVSPDINGIELKEAKIYNLTARPDPGSVFKGWLFQDGYSPYTFGLRIRQRDGVVCVVGSDNYEWPLPGDTIEADFVPNPFITKKGSYVGSWTEFQQHFGGFNLNVSDAGAFTCALTLDGKKYALTGQFFGDGLAYSTFRYGGQTNMFAEISINLQESPDKVSLFLSTYLQPYTYVRMAGERVTFDAQTNPATNFAGRYTFICTDYDIFFGDGWGTATVDTSGTSKAIGKFPDGTPFTLNGPVFEDGYWPVSAVLRGPKNVVAGWPALIPGINYLGYELLWYRAGIGPNDPFFADELGWTPTVISSPYMSPTNQSERLLGLTNFFVTFSGGGLPDTFSTPAMLLPGNRVVDLGSNGLSLIFQPNTGSFAGKVTPPGITKPISFSGAVLQNQNSGSGFFLNKGHGGRVNLVPPNQGFPGTSK